MSKTTQTQPVRKTWSTPRLNRLGTIADVAGGPTPLAQATGTRS